MFPHWTLARGLRITEEGCITRTNKVKLSQIEQLHIQMSVLKHKEDDKSKAEIDEVMKAIGQEEEKKYTILMSELNKLEADKEGRIDAQKFWKINNKLFPKSRDPPVAILDKHGNLVTADKAIETRRGRPR